MHTPKKCDPCIFDLGAGCIHYQGGFVVKAPWRRRKLENYEFSGNSLERVKALLYMRQNWGGVDLWLSFMCKICYFNSGKFYVNKTRPNITDIYSTTDDINILKGRFFFQNYLQ